VVQQQFNMGAQQLQQQQQQQQLRLQQQQQLRLMRLLVKIIKANGLADGDFGLYMSVLFCYNASALQPNKTFICLFSVSPYPVTLIRPSLRTVPE